VSLNDHSTLVLLLLGVTLIGDVIWIWTDPRPKAEQLKRKISFTYPRVTLALLPQIASGLFFPWPDWSWNRPVILAGVVLFAAGFFLAVWARFTMGSRWNPPAQHAEGRQDRLIARGPFAWTRHPIYLGSLLITLGFALAVRSYFFFVVVFLYRSFRDSALAEERLMEKAFGAEYLAYQARVPRFL
jgi:protein-S-isoprenylcysteine O-methyltransferase Ste14